MDKQKDDLYIAFKLSIGIELFFECFYYNCNKENSFFIAPKTHQKKYKAENICNGGGAFQMVLDTINPINWFNFFKIIKSHQPKRVHFLGPHSFNAVSCILLKLFFRDVKTFSVIHDSKAHSSVNYKKIFFIFQYIQIKLTDHVILLSDYVKKEVTKIYPIAKKNIHTILIPSTRMKAPSTQTHFEKKYISFIGRLEGYQGIDTFMEIARSYKHKNSDVSFFLGGAGQIEKIIDVKNIPTNVVIRNEFIPNKDIDLILQKSFCMLLPYKDATQSGIIPLSFYNSCPVICSDVGSFSEFIKDKQNGFVIKSGSIDDYVLRIDQIVNDQKLLEKLSLNSLRFYEKNLSPSSFIKKYNALENEIR